VKVISILHITPSYLPNNDGTSVRLNSLIQPLIRGGLYRFYVIAMSNSYRECTLGKNLYVYSVSSLIQMALVANRVINKVDLIHVHSPRYLILPSIFLKMKPIILEIHSILKSKLYKEVAKKALFSIPNGIIALSNSMKDIIANQYYVKPERIDVIPNGVCLREFVHSDSVKSRRKIRKKYNLSESEIVVGYIGTFFDWQGTANIIKAASYVIKEEQNVKFMLVGGGPNLRLIQEMILKFNLEKRIILTGVIPHSEVKDYYYSMDIFVVPRPSSLTTETVTPLKLLEAMAAGRAIIVTNVKGLTEIAQGTAVIVEPDDVRELAKAIIRLVRDKKLRLYLGSRSRDRVAQMYEWEILSSHLDEVYRKYL